MEKVDAEEFIKKIRVRIEAALKYLNRPEEDVFRDFNSKVTKVKKKPTSTDDEELPLPPSCSFDSVVLDEKKLQQLLGKPNVKAPQKFSDLQINFTREDKLKLYEYTVKQKAEIPITHTVEKDLVSFGDIVALKRREKTRRRKYRISKPTQTEEVRSLVELQMQALKQYLETNQKDENDKNSIKREDEMHYRPKGDDLGKEKHNRYHKRRDDEYNENRETEKYDARSKRRIHERYFDSRTAPSRERKQDGTRSRRNRRSRSSDRNRSRSIRNKRSRSRDRCGSRSKRNKRSRSRDRSDSRHKSHHHPQSKKRKKEKRKKHRS